MKLRSRMLLLLMWLTASASLSAQKSYVHLKNGTVIKGKLMYSDDADALRIKSSGNIYAYHRADVDSITTKWKANPKVLETNYKFYFRVGISTMTGPSANEEERPISFQGSFNHTFYKQFSVGLGCGMEYYKEVTFVPAYVNLEHRFRNTRFSPFVYTKVGYLFAADEKAQGGTVYYNYLSSSSFAPTYSHNLSAKGGFLINPGIGFNIMLGTNFGLGFGVGYRYHSISFNGENDYKLDYQYNRLTFDIGILFK